MRCETLRKWISDDLDGVLRGKRKARLERHLRECAGCRAYREDLARLQAGAEGLAEPGLNPQAWADFSRRLERKLAGSGTPARRREKAPVLIRSKRAWAAASFLVLVVIGAYFALRRPAGFEEPGFASFEDSVAQVFGEIGSNPDLENTFNREILASIEEAVRPALDEIPVPFGDNPLFWEGLSEGELSYIETELQKERGQGGLP
jgi:hypothetical protein